MPTAVLIEEAAKAANVSRLLRLLWLSASAASLLFCVSKGVLCLIQAHLVYLLPIILHGVIMPSFWFAFRMKKQNAAAKRVRAACVAQGKRS